MTTRRLVILRHAKAANPEGVADADRPLTPRGHADATAAGEWLVQHGLQPDVVLCSPSRRTRETWHAVAPALTGAPSVRYEAAIYLGSVDDLMTVVQTAPDEATTALLIGHNPGLSQLSTTLDPDQVDDLRTAALAVHTWDGTWAECGEKAAPLAQAHTARA